MVCLKAEPTRVEVSQISVGDFDSQAISDLPLGSTLHHDDLVGGVGAATVSFFMKTSW